MFETLKMKCRYSLAGQQREIDLSADLHHQDMHVTMVREEKPNQEIWKCIIEPHGEITLQDIRLIFDYTYDVDERIFCNGYQSWTDSREYFQNESMKGLSVLAKPLFGQYHFDRYGDHRFKAYSNKRGRLHGWTYAYTRREDHYRLLGSLSEEQGFTLIEHDVENKQLSVSKDCSGLKINSTYSVFQLFYAEGDEQTVFDSYFSAMGVEPPQAVPMKGWTSWYNYYQDINESLLLQNLQALTEGNVSIDLFQIDDGYQTAVGDWLCIDTSKFPRGMKPMAEAIKKQGLKAGLWLSPFICEKNSIIYREKPHWIRKDNNGQSVIGGGNWSTFYALDLENPEVKAYIKEVFRVVLQDWGFDLVKLDFLYALCIEPTPTKTRGQIMCEGMAFLRECVGDKLILGCGVPLGAAFGQVDYCRIGCDISLDWDDKFYMKLFHRERVSTLHSLESTMGRWQLDGRAFLNDPDVFLLRTENMRMIDTQKQTVAAVNSLFGSLLMTSDDISQYDASQRLLFKTALQTNKACIKSVTKVPSGIMVITYESEGVNNLLFVNLTHKSIAFDAISHMGFKGGPAQIKPYESKILVSIDAGNKEMSGE